MRAAEELVSREKVDVLTGAFLSNIGLALTDFAKQKKFFYLASEPLTDKIVSDVAALGELVGPGALTPMTS